MKNILITFGGKAYDETTQCIVERAPKLGADEVWVYDDRWLLSSQFYERNKWLFSATSLYNGQEVKHGFGWCSWKPYIILDAMARLAEFDSVMYLDADTYPIADFSILFKMCERAGRVLFEAQGCKNDRFIRRDLWFEMGYMDTAAMHGQHACGRFQLFQVRQGNKALLAEWERFSTSAAGYGWHGSRTMEDFPDFTRHSSEQAVLTVLAYKYQIPLHREACQFGWPASPGCGQPEDSYPQLFHQKYCEGDRDDMSGSRLFYVPGEKR